MPDFKPGDRFVRKGQASVVTRVVIAMIAPNLILSSDGCVFDTYHVQKKEGHTEPVYTSPKALEVLNQKKLMAPSIDSIQVGDLLMILEGNKGVFALVAVIDRPRLMVYTQDGEIVRPDSDLVAKTGWHTDEKDLLTPKGWQVLNNIY